MRGRSPIPGVYLTRRSVMSACRTLGGTRERPVDHLAQFRADPGEA